MADKQTSFSDIDEEEFHISDDDIDHELDGLDDDPVAVEDIDDAQTSPPREEKKKANFLKGLLADRKRLVIVLIIVFAIVYAVSKLFSAKHQNINDIQPVSHPVSTKAVATEPREQTLANVQTAVDTTSTQTTPMPVTTSPVAPIASEPVAPAVVASPPVMPPLTAPTTPTPSSPQQTNDGALTQQMQVLQQDNQVLADKLAEVSAQLVQVTSAMNNLNNKVDNIAKQPSAPAVATAKPLPKLLTDQRYYVEAVVPGRAWIQTANGETITVTIGEEIKGLGNVVSIEPATGDVVTTSGEIIKYGPY